MARREGQGTVKVLEVVNRCHDDDEAVAMKHAGGWKASLGKKDGGLVIRVMRRWEMQWSGPV